MRPDLSPENGGGYDRPLSRRIKIADGRRMTEQMQDGGDRPRRVIADQVPEDRALLAAAATIGRDLARPDPRIYWLDMVVTAAIAYGALAAMLLSPLGPVTIVAAPIAILAFYRGISFIHELSHLKRSALPGFATAWNVLFGIPLLTPAFLYDDVHVLHHARTNYGTERDPEYLPLASMRRHELVFFLVVSILAPFGLLVRFALLAPLSLFSRRLRRWVIQRGSALAINPAFRRRIPTDAVRRAMIVQEAAASLWAIAIVALTLTGTIRLGNVLLCLAAGSAVALVNQLRTLVAHRWENDGGEPLSLTGQFLDSINVPPPALLPALWAPVGLRYHALHHLLPSIPYHALGSAHRRLRERLGETAALAGVDHPGLIAPLRTVWGAVPIR